jgi:hypothetical protein
MYNEEFFNDPDDTNSTMSNTNSSTLNSDKYEEKRMIKEYKRLDQGYRKIKKNALRKYTLEFYYTSTLSDTHIRNAISGERTRWRVGRKLEESLFFSVILATGELSNGPYVLFYDSPEQYEKHQNLKISQRTKEQWYEKHLNARSILYDKK